MSGDHAFLAPSSANEWGPDGCPAFPRMAKAFPQDGTTAEALEGEAAHHYVHAASVGTYAPRAGDITPQGYVITQEIVDCGSVMVKDIQHILDRGIATVMEGRLYMPQIHPTLNWGRTDFGACDFAAKVIYAWDYKFGHGYVPAFENWQVVDYVIGVANHFGVRIDETWTIDGAIYQPRSFHSDGPVKRWNFKGDKLLELQGKLHKAAMAASDPNAPYQTGPQCDYCPGRFACPALQAVAGFAIDRSLRGLPHTLTPANAGLALRQIRAARERLEAMETGLEEQVKAYVRKGDPTTGWEIFPSTGREKWTVPVSEVVAIGAALGIELAKPQEAITPAQARKKGLSEKIVADLAKAPAGEMKLKPLEEKNIRKAFQ